jgi:hypothetical protein
LEVVKHTGKVRMQFGLDRRREDAFAIFGAENQMNQDAGQ